MLIGNSIGVAVVGVVFFGAVPHGCGHAFSLSVAGLGGLMLGVAALSRMLPPPPGLTPDGLRKEDSLP
jgi:hypothetical protein